MSRYDDNDKDGLAYELEEFLENHTIYELLKIVADAVATKESEYTDK